MPSLAESLWGVVRRRPSEMAVYVTSRCNSQCSICHIWQKRPVEDLSPEVLAALLRDRTLSRKVHYFLTGGEFLLHPQYREILKLFSGRSYTLLSNGILVDRLLKTVAEFGVKKLGVSLDGPPATYCRVRGVDNYDNVVRLLDELAGKVDLSLSYTVSPWNSREDFHHVLELSRRYQVALAVGYYHGIEYFGVQSSQDNLYSVDDMLDTPYLRLYRSWAAGQLDLPCFGTRYRPVVLPNGDVNLCEAKQIRIGNLYDSSFAELWNAVGTRKLQQEYLHCNDCWLDCQRRWDIIFTAFLAALVPRWWLGRHFRLRGWEQVPTFGTLLKWNRQVRRRQHV